MRAVRWMLLVAIVLGVGTPIYLCAAAPKIQTAESAAQFYLRWRSTVLSAKTVEELAPFWDAETLEQFKMEPESAKSETLPMMKRFYSQQNDVKVVKETPTPTGVTLSLEGVDSDKKPLVGAVVVVKENGVFKVGNAIERWKPKG